MKSFFSWLRSVPDRLLTCLFVLMLIPVAALGVVVLLLYILLYLDRKEVKVEVETDKERAQRESEELYSIWGQGKEKN